MKYFTIKFQSVHTSKRSQRTQFSTLQYIPEGNLSDDQMSSGPQSAFTGGQLITGHAALPDKTGPRPLLLPATAMNTVGMPSPNKMFRFTTVDIEKVSHNINIAKI